MNFLMAWRLADDIYLTQWWPSLFMHMCVTQPQWVNSLRLSDPYMHQWTNHHCFRQWLVAWQAPSHYLNQCWNIVNWTLRNKLQSNCIRNSYSIIQENAFENVVWKMAAILFWPQCVKSICISHFGVNSKHAHCWERNLSFSVGTRSKMCR